jgi:ribulose-phosphate 3-epimerase
MKLAPSILTADFTQLGAQIQAAEHAGVDWFHLDVMDAHFVPNLSIGPAICAAVQKSTRLPCEAHLMMTTPDPFLADYKAVGMQRMIVHIEACQHVYATIQNIRKLGIGAGIALNPTTPLSDVEEILPYIDLVLLMSVVPGFGGQSYIAHTSQRIKRLRAMLDAIGSKALIEIDGGINASNLREIHQSGADMVVVGSAVFNKIHSIADSVAMLNNALYGKVVQFHDQTTLMLACAKRIVEIVNNAVTERGICHIALSGGNTPKALYAMFATPDYANVLDWKRIHIWWGDERLVSLDHPDSNYGMAHTTLLSRIPIPAQNIHRVQTELGAAHAAEHYHEALSAISAFDLILLGMGDDGHTASLFPNTLANIAPSALATHLFVEKLGQMRITLTPKCINNARHVMFMVTGANKRDTLNSVLHGRYQPDQLPAQIIYPRTGTLTWFTAVG